MTSVWDRGGGVYLYSPIYRLSPGATKQNPFLLGTGKTVQRALGHRQITTTEIYARVSDDKLRRAVTAA